MPDDLVKRLKDTTLTDIAHRASEIFDSTVTVVKEKYESSGLQSTVDSASQTTKGFLDSTGISDTAGRVAEVTGDQLDILSGAKVLELVEERLAIQSQYNNILATKLEEALDRIKKLEEAILARFPK